MWINIRQRLKYESPFVQSRMGDGEAGNVDNLFADQENVDVQRSGLMRCRPSSPELAFDGLQPIKQLQRLKWRRYTNDRVQEVRLRDGRPNGLGLVKARRHRDGICRRLDHVQNRMPCSAQRRPPVTQVGSKREDDPLSIARTLATSVRHYAAQFDTVICSPQPTARRDAWEFGTIMNRMPQSCNGLSQGSLTPNSYSQKSCTQDSAGWHVPNRAST